MCQKLESTAAFEGLCGALAKIFWSNALRRALNNLGDLFAVGADYHRVEMPVVVNAMTESAERKVAAAAEAIEDSALCGSSEGDVSAVERCDGCVNRSVLRCGARTSSLERKCALAWCRTEFVDREALVHV